MKTIVSTAIAVTVFALLLPLLLPLAASVPEPSPSPTAERAADETTYFTVLDGGEVKTVAMSEWLPGVVAAEMPASFEPEALKAQAVAARTFILARAETGTSAHPNADVCSDPNCCKAHADENTLREKWGDDYDSYSGKILSCVEATDGEYLSYGDKPIEALFHSSSAGRTEDASAVWAERPYLVSVETPETAADVPDYYTSVILTTGEFKAAILEAYPDAELSGEPTDWLGETQRDASGRVGSVEVGGISIPGTEMRKLFSLRSTAFTLFCSGSVFVFNVTGYGHGVGMSQYGANVLAQNGSDYREILSHYYPGTKLE